MRARHERESVDLAGGRRRAAGALGDVLVDLAIDERPRAEALDRRVDHPRIDLLDLLPREPHAIDRARAEVLDHHVAGLDQPREDLGACLGLRVERDAALVAVQHREVEAVDAGDVAQLAARRVAFAGLFDLDDVGAEESQDLSGRRSGLDVSHVQDTHAFQGLTHDLLSR
jgi:hypothetical protein